MIIDQELLKRAIDTWGVDAQTKMVREEALEVCMAIGKYLERNQNDDPALKNSLIAEIADMNIMIAQANLIFGEENIQPIINWKLSRLQDRLDKREF